MLASGPFRPAADLDQYVDDNDLWLVPGIIPKDGLVILASSPKTGKTCLATAIARAVATGTPFLGQPISKAPVLWCAYEETPAERRLLHQGLTHEDPLLVAYPDCLPPLSSRLPKTDRYGRRDLRDYDEPFVFTHAVAVGAKLIVIDCLHAAVESGSLADNAIARAVMRSLRTYSFHFHVSVLVLHHLTKSGTRGHQAERFADSAQILAASSCHFFMDREEETPERSRIVLHGKGRHPTPASRIDLVSQGILDYRIADDLATLPSQKRVSNVERILGLLSEGWVLTANEIGTKLDLKPGTVRNALNDLKSQGRIDSAKAARTQTRYRAADLDTEIV